MLAASAAVFGALKVAGAAYLVCLGIQSLRGGHASVARFRRGPPFVQGLVGNLLNPKAAVIFLTIIPHFMRPHDPLALAAVMLGTFAVILLIWLQVFGRAVARAGQAPAAARVRQRLRAVTGVVLIGLGLRLAFERR